MRVLLHRVIIVIEMYFYILLERINILKVMSPNLWKWYIFPCNLVIFNIFQPYFVAFSIAVFWCYYCWNKEIWLILYMYWHSKLTAKFTYSHCFNDYKSKHHRKSYVFFLITGHGMWKLKICGFVCFFDCHFFASCIY